MSSERWEIYERRLLSLAQVICNHFHSLSITLKVGVPLCHVLNSLHLQALNQATVNTGLLTQQEKNVYFTVLSSLF